MTSNSTSLIERFESVVERFADKVAIDDDNTAWTYNQLHDYAAALSYQLQCKVNPGTPVGIALPPDARFQAAILACLAAGCPCVPLSHEISAPVLQMVIDERTAAAPSLAKSLSLRCEPDSIANILYTSGTSGVTRKGVYQSQRNLLQDVTEYISAAELSANDGLTQLYAPQAIGAWRDIFGALLTGATLYVIDLRTQGFGRLQKLLRQGRLTVIHTMPPVLRAFFRGLKPDEQFDSVRLIYAAGDRLFHTDLEAAWRHLPERAAFYTGLGSTECSTLFRQWIITRNTPIETDVVPVGYSIAGRRSVVMTDEGQPAEPGTVGEIVVTSPHLALGYWANQDLTKQRFVRDPDGNTTFRTGDLGWEAQDGLLHFIGRRDAQVKVRGTLISLAMLEARLRTCRSVADASVLGYSRDRDQKIAAFVVSANQINENHVRVELGDQSRFISHIQVLESLPLLPNGKRDITQLRHLAEAINPAAHHTFLDNDPSTIIEQAWRRLPARAYEPALTWERAGGDSLSALELLIRLEEATHRTLSPEWFHNGMTPASLQAALLGAQIDVPECDVLPRSRLFIAPGLEGANFALLELVRSLRSACKIDLLHFPDYTDLRAQFLDKLIAATKTSILADTSQDLHLLGYSYGARFAFHLAAQLEHVGRRVRTVIMIDTPPEGGSVIKSRHNLSARVNAGLKRAKKSPAFLRDAIVQRLVTQFVLHGISLPPRFFSTQSTKLAAERVRLLTMNQQELPTYNGQVYLLRSHDPVWQHCLPDFGWSRYTSRLETVEISTSTHANVLRSPELFSVIRRILKHE